MKKAWNIFNNIVICLIVVLAVCMMIFTVFSVNTFDRNDRTILGYRLLVVLSDSMSATDFDAGDLIFVKETDPQTLKAGDVIAYISRDPDNYGQTVAHKIRRPTMDEKGNPGFITYGTTTGVDDEVSVAWDDILGQYRMRMPRVGTFFSFLKTVPGYLLLILLPFLLLIVFQGANCVRLFREYREEEMTEIMAERQKLEEEREATRRMLAELQGLKEQLKNNRVEAAGEEEIDSIMEEILIEEDGKGAWIESEGNGSYTQQRSL